MHAQLSRRMLPLLLSGLFLTVLPAPGGAAGPPPAWPAGPAAGDASPQAVLGAQARAEPLAKLAPALRPLAAVADADRSVAVVVTSARRLDLGGFAASAHQFTWPAGEHVAILRVGLDELARLAALPGVAAVESGELDPRRRPREPGYLPVLPVGPPADPVLVRARLAAAPSWADSQRWRRQAPPWRLAPDGHPASPVAVMPDGWFDVRDGHRAAEAWGLGFQGEGVKVAVLDTGVDFGHGDLQGTWAVLPPGHPDAGWPQVYDPMAAYQYLQDSQPGSTTSYTHRAGGGLIQLDQAAPVTERQEEGQTVHTACLRALVQDRATDEVRLAPPDCNTRVPPSKSGTVRYGHHPDAALFGIRAGVDPDVAGEYVGVLLVDAGTAGVYDTVYVDLDADHDFTDEKPVTKESPLSWRDIDSPPDGAADLSGGLLYYIADGRRPIPAAYLWGLEKQIPAAGSLVGLFVDYQAHGSLCGSAVVSQGRLALPESSDLRFRDLPDDGRPESGNPGMAPRARLVGVGNIYDADIVFDVAWRYAVLGPDPERPDDNLQVVSNSYGWSDEDNDGWDRDSRFLDYYVRHFSPTTTFLFATGNGAPGYGTVAPPKPSTAVAVGASTQHGASVHRSITETAQITFGDVSPFSNRGPGADGGAGVHINASGDWGWGATPINYGSVGNLGSDPPEGLGSQALDPWAGTSRSAPVASGAMALVYQAFKTSQGRWPSWEEARAVLMAGARYAGYDTFTMGAGVLDAADAVRLAAGRHGVYALPAEWTAGDYRGQVYPAFAKLMAPGATSRHAITLTNPSDHPIAVTLRGQTLRRLATYEDELTTNLAAESPDNTTLPAYVLPVRKEQIPPDTELLLVRAIVPLDEVDVDLDRFPLADNGYAVSVLQHTDIDGDGRLWEDGNGNGAVNYDTLPDEPGALDWSTVELDRYEFEDLASHEAQTNNWLVGVHHPLERWKDGLHIALRHSELCFLPSDPSTCFGRSSAVPRTTVRFRIDAYGYHDWPWLSVAQSDLTIPARGASSIDVGLTVPAAAAAGAYQGAIFADYDREAGDQPVSPGGGYELPQRRLVVPVQANVALSYDWRGMRAAGGAAARDADAPYDNGALFGVTDWAWRQETGDWRFFFVDAMADPPAGTRWLVRTTWQDDVAEQSDIDMGIWGPAADRFSDPGHPDNGEDNQADPAWYGPYTLERKAQSGNAYVGGGAWSFATSSGGNEDWLTAPADAGLTEIMLHNVLFGGRSYALPFATTVSSARLHPDRLSLTGQECATVRLTSQIDLPGFTVQAAGLSTPKLIRHQPLSPDAPFITDLTLTAPAARFVVDLVGEPNTDVDLYLYYDANRDGQFEDDELLAGAESPTERETIALAGFQPAGRYRIQVEPYTVPAGGTFVDLTIDVVSGNDLAVTDVPPEVRAGQEVVFTVCTAGKDEPGPLEGVLVMGPEGGPAALSVPVEWTRSRAIFLPAARKED